MASANPAQPLATIRRRQYASPSLATKENIPHFKPWMPPAAVAAMLLSPAIVATLPPATVASGSQPHAALGAPAPSTVLRPASAHTPRGLIGAVSKDRVQDDKKKDTH